MANEDHIKRVRGLCLALPNTSEKLSHGAPTFFAGKRVFTMFSNNHHNDGHVAVWIPAEPGAQAALIRENPACNYKPPYVGPSGWVGIELDQIGDDELAGHLSDAWKLVIEKQKKKGSPSTRTRRSSPRS
jgi:hypothetical protein